MDIPFPYVHLTIELARISSGAMAAFLTLLDDNGNYLWLADSVAVEVSAFWGVHFERPIPVFWRKFLPPSSGEKGGPPNPWCIASHTRRQ